MSTPAVARPSSARAVVAAQPLLSQRSHEASITRSATPSDHSWRTYVFDQHAWVGLCVARDTHSRTRLECLALILVKVIATIWLLSGQVNSATLCENGRSCHAACESVAGPVTGACSIFSSPDYFERRADYLFGIGSDVRYFSFRRELVNASADARECESERVIAPGECRARPYWSHGVCWPECCDGEDECREYDRCLHRPLPRCSAGERRGVTCATDTGRICRSIQYCASTFSFLRHAGCFWFMVLTVAASMVIATLYNWLTRGIAIRLAAATIGRQCCTADRWFSCSGGLTKAERAALIAGWRYHQIAIGLVGVFLVGALSDAVTNAGATFTGALNAIFGALMLGPLKELGACTLGWVVAACKRRREQGATTPASESGGLSRSSPQSGTSNYV